MKDIIFWGTFKGKKSLNGVLQKYFGAQKYFEPLTVGFFGPGGYELKLSSNFCFFHFLKNFIILIFFFKIPLKNIWSNFFKNIFDYLMRNFFLILKWFYFLSFSQNWPICRGLKFSLLKIDDFPFS